MTASRLEDILKNVGDDAILIDIDLEQTEKELLFLDNARIKTKPITESWDDFEKRLHTTKSQKNMSKKWMFVLLLGLLTTLGYLGYHTYLKNKIEEYQTKRGEIYAGSLPDGSTYNLNTISKISYVPGRWSEKRALELTGQAYFDVKKGESFLVNTKNGSVKVYGTRFDVKSYSDHITVTCFEGKVGVIDPAGVEKMITAQQQISIYKGHFTQISSINAESSDWKSGFLTYSNQNILYILQDLEKHYDISFELSKENKAKYFTGQIMLGDLNKSLELLCVPLNISYKISQKKVKL